MQVDPSAVTPDMQANLRNSLVGSKKGKDGKKKLPAANDEPADAEPAGKKTKKALKNKKAAAADDAEPGPDEGPLPMKRGRATSNLTVHDDATNSKKAKVSKNRRAETTDPEESGHKRTPKTRAPTRAPSPPAHGGCSKCRRRRNGCRKCNPAYFAGRWARPPPAGGHAHVKDSD